MNPFHVSNSTGILVRSVSVRGIKTLPEANNDIETAPKNTRETTKFNQVQGLYIGEAGAPTHACACCVHRAARCRPTLHWMPGHAENCNFWEATDNIIDAVAVQVRGRCAQAGATPETVRSICPSLLLPRALCLQYGHVIWSLLHGAGFGVYVKGGSAHMILSGNRVFDTGEGGLAFAAGFDTGEPPHGAGLPGCAT